MHDFPLVLFTVLSQVAIGALVTLWLLEITGKKISVSSGFTISSVIAGIAIVGVLISLFHLGHPLEAYRAILNIGESWLSREVTVYAIFILFSLMYCYFWKADRPANRKTVGALATLFGAGTIFSSAMIYTIPAIPAWNSGSTTLSFFLTSILLGPIFVGAVLQWRKEQNFDFSRITLVSTGLSVIFLVVYLTSLFSGLEQAAQSGVQIVNSGMFWIRMALLGVVLAMLLPTIKGSKSNNTVTCSLMFLLLMISELLGRILFYTTAVHL
ncbi:dimethyl sulfoxide reductase anchor subunit family protein [Brevibacillus sp. SYSU BS000544]|uniref:dimethyl sulfoxide reductase anchor subunit family protein n=1 Tax=Brevibacillus sp. SYSU BS000544 TaxID=3416443 RepID=UPI003CE588DF